MKRALSLFLVLLLLCALLPLGLGLYVFRRNEHKFVFHL